MKKFIATALLLLCCTLGFAQEIAADSPYEVLLSDRTFTFSFVSLIKGIVGMGVIVFVCWCFSSDRKNINWGTVGKALLMQFAIAVSVLVFPAVQSIFEILGNAFVSVLDWTKAGSTFLFGGFMDASKFGFVFIFQILPTIIFFSALMSLFFYLGIMPI